MALMQLTLPDESQEQIIKKVVGIDLGTTNSLVATVVDSKVVVICDTEGKRIVPSAVRYFDDKVEVGHLAIKAQEEHPSEVVVSAKRLMGRSRSDVDKQYSYEYVDKKVDKKDAHEMVQLNVAGKVVSPVQISADILSHLARQAKDVLGDMPEAAVITVPAYFDDSQRQATKDAANIAGIEVLRLLNEPTAAALAYGLDSGEKGIYVVYDLGGGTFDVSLLKLSKGVFEVLGTGGDTALGGDDFDEILALLALEKSKQPRPESLQWRALIRVARIAKETLSESSEVQIDVLGSKVTITSKEFIDASQQLVDRTISILEDCLSESELAEINGVIMVGGSSRLPQVRQAVKAKIKAPLLTDIDPDEVVAVGAAAQADILAGNRSSDSWLLLDVTPLSLGIETMGGLVERIIPRNSPIPITRAQEFTTYKDGQSAMSVHVVQGERDLAKDCRSLARFSLRDIPNIPAGTARIRVTYRADADGILSVSAKEETTGTNTSIEVKPSYGLDEKEVTQMIQAATNHASEDAKARVLTEARTTAQSMLGMIGTALEIDMHLVGDDFPLISQTKDDLFKASKGDDAEQINTAIAALDKACGDFAQRRMQEAIKISLSGCKISELK